MPNNSNVDDHIVHDAIHLARGGMLRIDDGSGMLVEACDGSLWLTQEGDTRDIDVCPDESFRLDRNGLAVITTFRGGVVRLRASTIHGHASRIVVRRSPDAEPVVIYALRGRRATPFAALADGLIRAALWLAQSWPALLMRPSANYDRAR